MASHQDVFMCTTNITKDAVVKHSHSKVHAIAVGHEKELTDTAEHDGSTASAGSSDGATLRKQPRIDDLIKRQAREAYRKLLITAYMLAADGAPMTAFTTAVKIQKLNGVKLIKGVQSSQKAREFVHYIGKSIRQKLSKILSTCAFFSTLADGSQPKKTGSEKELVYIRCVRNGTSVYYAAALANIDDLGNASADNVKKAIDQTFIKKLKCTEESYNSDLVGATADGASVNFGRINGVLTQMKAERDWLVTIHCALHRTELALGDSLKQQKPFKDMFDFMVMLFYLFKRSGKIKRCLKETAKALGVQVYVFPKIHGTRFISHTRRGLDHLLKNWVPLAITLENMQANHEEGQMKQLNAKVRGIVKRLHDLRFLVYCNYLKHVLDILGELSLKLEQNHLLVFDVWPLVEMTVGKVNDLSQDPSDTQLSDDGHIKSSSVDFSLVDGTTLKCDLVNNGDNRKKRENRSYTSIQLDDMKFVQQAGEVSDVTLKRHLNEVSECLNSRFESFQGDVFPNMCWVDPANWAERPEGDVPKIEAMADHFHVPLQAKGFDRTRITREWKDLRILVRNYYASVSSAKELWKKILQFRRKSFPNICLLVELAFSIAATTGVVESGFSHLTSLMNDRRLTTSHATVENLLLIKLNDKNWTQQDKDDIIDNALDDYMQKRRVVRLESTSATGTQWARGQLDEDVLDDDDDDSIHSSDDDSDAESVLSSDDSLSLPDDEEEDVDLGDLPDVEDFSYILDADHSHPDHVENPINMDVDHTHTEADPTSTTSAQ